MYMRRGFSGQDEVVDTKIASTIAGAGISAAVSGGFIPAIVGGPVGLAIAALAVLVQFLFTTSKEGQEKIAATKIVDQAAALMQQNLDAWKSEPHTYVNQQAALANFDNLWSQIVQACSNGLESAGQRCISERQRGGKWDYTVYYRDPISSEPVIDVPFSTAGIANTTFSDAGLDSSLLIPAALILLAVSL